MPNELETKAVAAETEPDNDPDDPCIAAQMKKLMADGSMDKAAAMKKAQAACAETETSKARKPKKSFDERLREGLKTLGLLKETDEYTGFKVVGNQWVAFWSNNFQDRDKEIFTEKAIDAYVARVDMGIVPLPSAAVWHLGEKTYIGKADWVARHGHFLVAAGAFAPDDASQAAKSFYSTHAKDTGISHGFTYPKSAFDGKHYHQFNSFEISLMPRGAEANWYTSLEGVKAMALDEKKVQYLKQVFGEEHATRILSDWDKRGKALEELGVEFKDFVDPNADTTSANKEAVEQANQSLVELFPELMEGSAEAVTASTEAVKAVKAMRAENATLKQAFKELQAEVKAIRDGAPRASQSSKTVIDEDDPLAAVAQRSEKKEKTAKAFPGLYPNDSP